MSALCAEVDPELWFPEKGGSSRAARRICARCPVSDACLQEALTAEGGVFGIWAGTSHLERLALKA